MQLQWLYLVVWLGAGMVDAFMRMPLSRVQRPSQPQLQKRGQIPLTEHGHRKFPRAPLVNDVNILYFNITMGNPPQSARVMASLGSSELWVLSREAGPSFCHNHDCYSASDSKTHEKRRGSFEWNHPEYTQIAPFTGKVSADVLGLGTKEQSAVLDFGELSDGDLWDLFFFFYFEQLEGVFGMSPRKFGENGLMNPVHHLLERGDLDPDEPTFALFLGEDAEITFGGYDKSHLKGKLTTVSLSKDADAWTVDVDEFIVGDEKLDLGGKVVADLDSSSPFIGMPSNIFALFEAQYIPSPGYGPEVCDARDDLPDLTFKIGDENIILSAYDYIVELEEGFCVPAIEPYQGRIDDDLKFRLGLPFFEGHFTAFDVRRRTIGFAKAA